MSGMFFQNQIETLKSAQPPESDPKMEMVREVMGTIKTFGDQFLAARGAQGELMKQMVLKDERIKQLQEENGLIDVLFNEGSDDPEIGPEKMRRLFMRLGFDPPAEEPETPTPINQESAAPAPGTAPAFSDVTTGPGAA